MDRNFERALTLVLKHEGGWADHPKDPGGATMKGVTLATYRQYRPGATKADLRAISDADLQIIYRSGYWDKVRGDDLPSGLDYAVFDFGVNSGPGRAAKALQRLVGVPEDGQIGPVTLAAVAKVHSSNLPALINAYCDARMKFLKGLGTFATFGKGWTNRVSGVRKDALLMAASPAPPIPDVPTYPQPEPAKGKGGINSVAVITIIIVVVALAAAIFFRA